MEEILVPFIVFAAIFGVIYVYLSTRNKERLALIEKGADATLFKSGYKFNWKNFSLTTGLFLVGIGLGIMVGAILYNTIEMDEGAAYTLSIFLFAGLSLIVNYLIVNKDSKPIE